jgi:pimeloyl-ACP methyl ester carboxylesterase
MDATFVLVPGAGGAAWYWHRVVGELEARGKDAIAVDLPAGDESAGLAEYTDVVVDAIGGRRPIVLVAQSMGGFTAPLVCERVSIELLILVNAMIPRPGETGQEWWTATGWQDEVGEVDMVDAFFHDVPEDVRAAALSEEPPQSATPFQEPWPLETWPDVQTRFVQGRDDRFFPLEFQRRVVRDRLAIDLDEVPGGHLVALSRPVELVVRLEELAREAGAGRQDLRR